MHSENIGKDLVQIATDKDKYKMHSIDSSGEIQPLGRFRMETSDGPYGVLVECVEITNDSNGLPGEKTWYKEDTEIRAIITLIRNPEEDLNESNGPFPNCWTERIKFTSNGVDFYEKGWEMPFSKEIRSSLKEGLKDFFNFKLLPEFDNLRNFMVHVLANDVKSYKPRCQTVGVLLRRIYNYVFFIQNLPYIDVEQSLRDIVPCITKSGGLDIMFKSKPKDCLSIDYKGDGLFFSKREVPYSDPLEYCYSVDIYNMKNRFSQKIEEYHEKEGE